MRKIQVVLLAVFAVFALSAVAASSAFAAHEWLDLNGNPPAAGGTAGLVDGSLLLHHKPPAILGGGTILISCTGQFHGLFFTGGKDEITDILGLLKIGDSTPTWLNLAHCEVLSSTNGTCAAKTLILVHAVDLPWSTELLLEGTNTYDDVLASTKGEPGYETECKTIKITCTSHDRSKWLANGVTGSEFAFEGELTASCTDGGTGTYLGGGTVLEWFVH